MEILGLINLPWWLISCLVLIFTIIVYSSFKRSTFKRLGLPTKSSTFLLGDLGQIAKKGFTLYDVELVKKYGRVYGAFMGNSPMLVITEPEMIKTIAVKQFNNFSQRMVFKSEPNDLNDGLSVANGVYWKYLRSILSRCFTSGKLRAMNNNVSICIERLMTNIHNQISEKPDGIDMIKVYRAYTMDVICSTGFGMEVDSQKDPNNPFLKHAELAFSRNFTQNITIMVNMFFPDLPGLQYIKFQSIVKKVWDFFSEATANLLAERKQEGEVYRDILQAMIDAQRDEIEDIITSEKDKQTLEDLKKQGLTNEQVIANSILFVLGAYETTSVTLSWLTYDLAVNTDVQDKLIKEIDEVLGTTSPTYDNLLKLQYLDMVFEETARFHPVATVMMRSCSEDTDVCGTFIPAGMNILVPAFTMHFLPEYWHEPMEYNPERFAPENKDNLTEYAYIPFGMGPRNCIGMRLAILEVKMCIVSILQKYRIQKTDQLPVPMPGEATTVYRPAKPVMIKLVPRK